MVKPFIKWAGGKNQLLNEIRKTYPEELGKKINRYCEPFIGGGAVLFDILNNFSLDEIYISDSNAELINTYKIVQMNVHELIFELTKLQNKYIALEPAKRKELYNKLRNKFNKLTTKKNNEIINLEKASLFIFLNKTCFNGLFRVNNKGMFNVPMGSYIKPLICDKSNLLKVNNALKNIEINCGDYQQAINFIDNKTFVYIDPPYRPLTTTSNFNSYNNIRFDDNEQIRLANFVNQLDELGASLTVSNSDPKNIDCEDNFFDELYKTLTIKRVPARRMINSKARKRGEISELLMSNCKNTFIEENIYETNRKI